MKKLIFALLILTMTFTFIGCNGKETESDIDLTVLKFTHVDGYGTEIKSDMPILFQYEEVSKVKYQVAFVACTCRPVQYNFWSVAYIDISKTTGEVLFMSFYEDSEDKYTAGVWGDSDPIPGTGLTYKDDFKPGLIDGWLVGKTQADLDGINIIFDDVSDTPYGSSANTKPAGDQEFMETYAGSSVTANNLLRITKTLLDYHQETYMNK